MIQSRFILPMLYSTHASAQYTHHPSTPPSNDFLPPPFPLSSLDTPTPLITRRISFQLTPLQTLLIVRLRRLRRFSNRDDD